VDDAPDQDRIYYLLADSPGAARSSPHLEAFRARNIEVLLLTDRLDEWAMQYLTEYRGKSFRDVARGGLELPGEKTEKAAADKGQAGSERRQSSAAQEAQTGSARARR
jgi:molecular chaperone HtpG